VICSGVDGLVAAHYLARSGRQVIVLEPRPDDGLRPDVGWIPPRIVRDLGLERHGLEIDRADPWVTAPLPDGGRLELRRDMSQSADAIRRLSPADAAKWPAFCGRMHRLASVLEALYGAPPPDPLTRDWGELARLGRLGWRVRRLGKQAVVDLLRYLPMSVGELLDEWFENDALKGVLAAAGIMHLCQGPRSGGTGFLLLHHHVGSPAGVFRPPVSNLARVLRQRASAGEGIEVRRADVSRITVRAGRISGVVLAGGEEIATSLVVSGVDPKRTLLGLVDPGWLDPELVHAVRHIKCRGVVARATLTLAQAPGFTALAVAPSLEYLERAYDDAKYGRVSRRPYLEARLRDGGNAHPTVEVHAQYAPYALAEGEWNDARRRALGDSVVDVLSEHVPRLREMVMRRVVELPGDLEGTRGYPEGNAYHGEMTLDQVLFMRPVPQAARYHTPIRGLYLCGPGTHPGGGIPGASGANAARVILRESGTAVRR
jgi:phytoene dehydrogenase-like protein